MISAIILAAGNSERMGRPKALLEVEGQTFLERISQRLWESQIRDITVVLGRDAAEIQKRWPRRNERVVVNPCPEDGQISSLQLALRMVPVAPFPEAVFVCLVDAPLVETATYRLLMQKWMTVQGSMVVPRFNGKRGHPLILDHRFWHECQLAPLDQGLHWVTHRHPDLMVDVEVDDRGVVTDIDTPEDYKVSTAKKG